MFLLIFVCGPHSNRGTGHDGSASCCLTNKPFLRASVLIFVHFSLFFFGTFSSCQSTISCLLATLPSSWSCLSSCAAHTLLLGPVTTVRLLVVYLISLFFVALRVSFVRFVSRFCLILGCGYAALRPPRLPASPPPPRLSRLRGECIFSYGKKITCFFLQAPSISCTITASGKFFRVLPRVRTSSRRTIRLDNPILQENQTAAEQRRQVYIVQNRKHSEIFFPVQFFQHIEYLDLPMYVHRRSGLIEEENTALPGARIWPSGPAAFHLR